MASYKINYIYDKTNNKTINDIVINVLKKEIYDYLKKICKSSNRELTYKCTCLSLQDKEESN